VTAPDGNEETGTVTFPPRRSSLPDVSTLYPASGTAAFRALFADLTW